MANLNVAELVDEILDDADCVSAGALARDLSETLGTKIRADEVAELADDLEVPRMRGGAYVIDRDAATEIVETLLDSEDSEDSETESDDDSDEGEEDEDEWEDQ